MTNMLNYALQRHISHVLLLDTETPTHLRELSRNAKELHDRFCELFQVPRYKNYTLILALQKSNSDLETAAKQVEAEMNKHGVKCAISSVADEDMMLVKGKAGLLSCSMWTIAGAVLLNDIPIPLH